MISPIMYRPWIDGSDNQNRLRCDKPSAECGSLKLLYTQIRVTLISVKTKFLIPELFNNWS